MRRLRGFGAFPRQTRDRRPALHESIVPTFPSFPPLVLPDGPPACGLGRRGRPGRRAGAGPRRSGWRASRPVEYVLVPGVNYFLASYVLTRQGILPWRGRGAVVRCCKVGVHARAPQSRRRASPARCGDEDPGRVAASQLRRWNAGGAPDASRNLPGASFWWSFGFDTPPQPIEAVNAARDRQLSRGPLARLRALLPLVFLARRPAGWLGTSRQGKRPPSRAIGRGNYAGGRFRVAASEARVWRAKRGRL